VPLLKNHLCENTPKVTVMNYGITAWFWWHNEQMKYGMGERRRCAVLRFGVAEICVTCITKFVLFFLLLTFLKQ
jgi:hypothetical protein